MSKDRYRELLEELLSRKQAEEDFYTFVQQAWPHIEGGNPFVGGTAIHAICDHLEEVYYGRIKKLLINQPPRTSKALDIDTPILTTHGWVKHGDLNIGDFVFSPQGKAIRVLAITDHFEDECYELEFDDGAKIIAAKDHLWEIDDDVLDKKKWNRKRISKVVKTSDLVDKVSLGNRHNRNPRIGICGQINLPPQFLLIDPYILGAWIGDGTTSGGHICVGHKDIEHFKNYGRARLVPKCNNHIRKNDYWMVIPDNLTSQLRVRGLLGKNKHIPEEYLNSSIDQRIALLQGLMDTDGCCTQNGNATFSTKFENLANQILQLIRSLGLKGRIHSPKYTMLNGKQCGPYYLVSFCPTANFHVFRLKRKQERVKTKYALRAHNRYLNKISYVGKRQVNCIQVEGALYLAGKEFIKTHNSSLVSILFPVWVWLKNPGEQFLCTSYSEKLAVRDNVRSRRLIKSKWFQNRWGDRITLAEDQDTKLRVDNMQGGYRVVAGVGGTVLGEGGNYIICDDINAPNDGSEAALENSLDFFTNVLPTRFNDFKTGRMIVVQQRLSEKDVSGYIISNQGDEFVKLILPMEFEEDRRCVTVPVKSTNGEKWTDWRTEEGDILWPERFGKNELKSLKRALGTEYAIAGQLQQRPAPAEGGMIKRAWFQPWKSDEPPAIRFIIQAWDTAMSTKKGSSYSASTTWGIFKDDLGHDGLILLAAWRKRVEFPELYKAVQRMALDYRATTEEKEINERYKPDLVLVEEKASGVQLIQTLNKTGIVLVGWRPDKYGDKVERVRRVTHLMEAGRVYVPYKGPGFTKPKQYADFLISQAAVFPAGDGADLVDTMSCVLQRCINSGWLLHSLEHGAMEQAAWNREYKQQEQRALY